MSTTKRQEQILELLQENNFLTVERLSEMVYTSPSSIRRDLSHLQNVGLIKRTHGGATILCGGNRVAAFDNRVLQNPEKKRKIAKKAADLISDGQTIMLDGSSTAGYLIPHIAKHKDIILFTNNMSTALNAINYGINTHCFGGSSVNNSSVLAGPLAYKNAAEIRADVLFFSSCSLNADGIISDPTEEENYLRSVMLKSATKKVFLCDSEKFGTNSLYTLATLDDIDVAVFDEPFAKLKKSKCLIFT